MPSFKSCFASLAVVALAFSPVTLAHKSTGKGLSGRDMHHRAGLAVGDALLDRRHAAAPASSGELAKRKLSAIAAARAAAAAAKKVTSTTSAAVAAATSDPYAPGSTFMTSALAEAAALHRCGTDAVCVSQVAVPADAFAFCNAGHCTFRCDAGFEPSGTDCIPEPTSCGTTVCPTVPNGFTTCNGDTCVANCQTDQGFTLMQNLATGAYACYALLTDPDNCNSVGTVCPASYNLVGQPKCRNGACILACPRGTSLHTSSSSAEPFFCA